MSVRLLSLATKESFGEVTIRTSKGKARYKSVTPRVMKILIKLLKMQLSIKAREDQAVEVANQNLNYQDFKFKACKCCLVWTDIPNQQIFRIDRSQIRSHS
jgi:hypothetical protein